MLLAWSFVSSAVSYAQRQRLASLLQAYFVSIDSKLPSAEQRACLRVQVRAIPFDVFALFFLQQCDAASSSVAAPASSSGRMSSLSGSMRRLRRLGASDPGNLADVSPSHAGNAPMFANDAIRISTVFRVRVLVHR
jgi:hypothetical protein